MDGRVKQASTAAAVISSGLVLIFLATCTGPDYPPSIWDPDEVGKPDPVIYTLAPEGGTWAGVGLVTITGDHFSAVPDENLVYFGEEQGTVMSASTTQLVIKAPIIVGDSLKLQISVLGAFQFADTLYKLEYVAIEYGGIDDYSNIYGLAADSSENIYASSSDKKVILVSRDGVQSDYYVGAYGFASGMKMGPGGYLYGAETQFISRILPDGSAYEIYGGLLPKKTYDIDFDANENLFTACRDAILCLKTDASYTTEATYDKYNLMSIRVFSGYVYVAGNYYGTDTTVQVTKGIWKHQILDAGGALGTGELVVDWSGYVGRTGPVITAITFDADGYLYVGAEDGNAVTLIKPDGSGNYLGSTPEAFYQEVLSPPTNAFCWGNGTYLYINNRLDKHMRLIRVDMEKNGAPYHGRP